MSSQAPRIPQRPAPPTHPSLRRQNEPARSRVEEPVEAASDPFTADDPFFEQSSPISQLPTPLAGPSPTPQAILTSPPSEPTPELVTPNREEEELSETQLRQLYEEEEIDRFLRLFSDHISEIRAPQSQRPYAGNGLNVPQGAPSVDADVSDNEGEGWMEAAPNVASSKPDASADVDAANGWAEWVALRIIPLLPPPPPPTPPFTVKRLRLTIRRLYLVDAHIYYPYITHAFELASWKDPKNSMKYCFLYWLLWYQNLLIAGLTLRLLYGLMRRKILVYPTLQELRTNRRWEDQADTFSKRLVMRLTTSPAEGVKSLWRGIRRKMNKKGEDSSRPVDVSGQTATPSVVPEIFVEDSTEDIDATGVRTEDVPLADSHLAGPLLDVANGLADVHERIRNLFLWRRPEMSALFSVVLVCFFFFSLLPVRYLAKLAGLALGICFWHVTPVIVALPPQTLQRLPPPLCQVPTDAEYAMELISRRVAQGLPVRPKRRKLEKRGLSTNSFRSESSDVSSVDGEPPQMTSPHAHLDKWAGRFVEAKAWTDGVKDILKDGKWKAAQNWPLIPLRAACSQEEGTQSFTYPAHRGAPGTITLTGTSLFFTTFTSTTRAVTVDLKTIVGVKRSSFANGLRIRWSETRESGSTEERNEKFLWVSGRDDLFARLIGSQSRRWLAM